MKLCILLLFIGLSTHAQVNFYGTKAIRYSTWPNIEDTTLILYNSGLFYLSESPPHAYQIVTMGRWSCKGDSVLLFACDWSLWVRLRGREEAWTQGSYLHRIIDPIAY